MRFECYEEGYRSGSKIVVLTDGTTYPRALAAAEFCVLKGFDGTKPVNVIVCPLGDAASALPGWIQGDDDDPRPYVCVLVTPRRRIKWTAEQVLGFDNYERMIDGECGSAETD